MAEFKLGRIRFVWKGNWNALTTYYKDDVVRFGGKTYLCQIGHTANADFNVDLDISPTKWNLMSDGQRWRDDWITGTVYEEGDLVKYGGTIYICIDGHTSAATAALGLEANAGDWNTFVEGFEWKGAWASSTRYKLNDIVRYGGINYICATHHTSAATVNDGLELDQSKWEVYSQGQEYKGTWVATTRYKLNDIVKYGAGLWICNTQHLSSLAFSSDSANWAQFVEGFEFENVWSNATAYQPGDVVRYGGNNYVAKTQHTDSNPLTGTTNWDLFSEGLKFQSDWNNTTSYKIGEVVRLNGYNYLAVADSPSTLVTVTSTSATTDRFTVASTTGLQVGMTVRFGGTTFGGVLSGARYYVKEIISSSEFTVSTTPGGTLFQTTTATGSMTARISAEPPNISYWTIISQGISWRGEWIDDTEYNAGDAVRLGSNAYICILAHRADGDDGSTVGVQGGGQTNSRPDLDITGTYWSLLNVGSELSVLTTVGDMVYYGGNGPTRLPVGAEGQVLRVGSQGVPEWTLWGATENVYYVAPHGEDRPWPSCGATLDKPWKSIRYACEQVENGPKNPQAQHILELNRAFIQREVTAWIRYQIENDIAPFTSSFVYDDYKCERDIGFVVDRIIWDIGHGGNLKTLAAALSYINALDSADLFSTADDENGTGLYNKLSTEGEEDVAAYQYMKTLVTSVLNNEVPETVYQNITDDSAAIVDQYIDIDYTAETNAITTSTALIDIVITALTNGTPDNLPARNVPNNSISVKTGQYRETLPIIVPAETAVLGEEVRSVNAGPAGSLVDESDSFYTIKTFDHLASVVSNIVLGTTVTPTAGNNAIQSQEFPFAEPGVVPTTVEKLVQVMKHQSDYRLGTMHTTFLTDPLSGFDPNARTLVKSNKKYLQEEVIAYLEQQYPTLKYGKTKSRRDAGYIVDAIIYDLTYGGNALSVQAGLAYYNAADPLQPLIPESIKQATLDSISFLKTRLGQVASNTAHTPLQTRVVRVTGTAGAAGDLSLIADNLDNIIEIVDAGPTVVGVTVTLVDPTPTNGVNTTTALITAKNTLTAALSTISAAAVSYINSNFPTLVYSTVKAARDTEIVLKAVSYDFMFDSNYQTIKAAYAYLRESVSGVYSSKLLKDATRASLEFARTQAIANVGGDVTAIARINSLMKIVDDIIFSGSNEGDVCQAESRHVYHATLQLERNREFIKAEVAAFIADEWPAYDYDQALCSRDVDTYIDALKWDLVYSSNYKSKFVARYYSNAVTGSLEEDMFYLRNGTGLRNMTLEGLTGDLLPENDFGTSRVSAGAYASLDPGWGPDDFRTWIIKRSPYVQNVTTFGYAAIGQKIDGALHNGGNDSIVSNDFTQVISDGIGAWVTNNGRAELVSVFTYYAHIGYLSENGGRIRGTNGNNSYGDFGSVAEGFDATETPILCEVDNTNFVATVGSILTDNINKIWQFEYDNAGVEYTRVNWTLAGGGSGAEIEQTEFRDGGVYQVRLLDNVDDSTTAPESDGNFGGSGYISNANTAQSGSTTAITIAAVDDEITGAYVGMKVVITGGTGAGQFGIISSYTAGTKVAEVLKESTGGAGWDHVVSGTTIVAPDASSTYVIEPRITLTAPTYSSSAVSLATGQSYMDAIFAPTVAIYQSVIGTTSGSGANASFTVVRRGTKYSDLKIINTGVNYERLDTITLAGSNLGGTDLSNSITVTITAVNSTTGAILSFEYTGVGIGGKFVAVADTRLTNTSVDGTTWVGNTNALPSASNWNSLAVGELTVSETAGGFVTGRAYVITSLGNTVWTAIGAPAQLVGTYFIATGPGSGSGTATPIASSLVAISSSTTVNAYSLDGGQTWASGGGLPASMSGFAKAVAYGRNYGAAGDPGTWLTIASNGGTATSTNGGITWSEGTSLGVGPWQSVAYGQGKWVAITSAGTATKYSTDGGITWTVGGALPTSSTWVSIAYGSNKFVAVSSDGAVSPAYSVDGGATWKNDDVAGWLNQTVTNVRYGQGVFVATNSATNNAVSSDDGINWTTRALTRSSGTGFRVAVLGNPNRTSIWAAIPTGNTTPISTAIIGARAKARAYVAENKIFAIRVTEPGSAYGSAPTITITDPNNLFEAPTQVRIGAGVLANPSFINRGLGYDSAIGEVDTGDGYADNFQSGKFMAVKRITGSPQPGANVVFASQPNTVYKLVNIVSPSGEFDGGKKAFFQISPTMSEFNSPANGTGITTRIRYSQVRLTGHDFLDIGTGNFEETNYPGLSTQPSVQSNETADLNGGRVFYTSTDQDGNFRVGELFTIEQSTGIATLNADAFNIAGLAELSLGNITLGGNSATITEFSTDPFLTANSDNVVPTQRAIKAYIAAQIGGGGASLNVNSIVAGFVEISGTQITTTTGGTIQMKANFNFQGGVRGLPIAWNYFFN